MDLRVSVHLPIFSPHIGHLSMPMAMHPYKPRFLCSRLYVNTNLNGTKYTKFVVVPESMCCMANDTDQALCAFQIFLFFISELFKIILIGFNLILSL